VITFGSSSLGGGLARLPAPPALSPRARRGSLRRRLSLPLVVSLCVVLPSTPARRAAALTSSLFIISVPPAAGESRCSPRPPMFPCALRAHPPTTLGFVYGGCAPMPPKAQKRGLAPSLFRDLLLVFKSDTRHPHLSWCRRVHRYSSTPKNHAVIKYRVIYFYNGS